VDDRIAAREREIEIGDVRPLVFPALREEPSPKRPPSGARRSHAPRGSDPRRERRRSRIPTAASSTSMPSFAVAFAFLGSTESSAS